MAARIPVEELNPGMVLAEPILNRAKKEVLSVGTTLTDSHVAAIKSWGLSFVTVQEETALSEIRPKAVQRVKGRMRWEPSNPIEEEIYKIALQRAEDLLLKKEEG
jgi:hypothetical protein